MSEAREDEFIEAWTGSSRQELSDSELKQALSAYYSLRDTPSELDTDVGVVHDQEQLDRQIAAITAQIPKAPPAGDTVVAFPAKRKPRWTPIIGAMAACLVVAVGLNLQMAGPQQSDDWGQGVVVRGGSDIETIDVSSSVPNPKKSAKSLVKLLDDEAGATYRSEKLSGSVYRVVFKLRNTPNDENLGRALAANGIASPELEQWYVLEFNK